MWPLVEADFHSEYGIDLDLVRDRSWRWFEVRVAGLVTADTRLRRHLRALEGDTATTTEPEGADE